MAMIIPSYLLIAEEGNSMENNFYLVTSNIL
jgi:hypothetical protein